MENTLGLNLLLGSCCSDLSLSHPSNCFELSLNLLELTIDSCGLVQLLLISAFQLLGSQEDPIEELSCDLDVVLELTLCLLVSGDRVNVECELFTLTAENSDEFLALLHTDNSSVLEDDFDCLVGECSEVCKPID